MSADIFTGRKLKMVVWMRVFSLIPTLMLVFFLPAGTFAFWQAWVYIVVLFTLSVLLIAYLLKHDPDLVIRRMQLKENRPQQKMIIRVAIAFFSISFFIPGFDQRFDWSRVPSWLIIISDLLIILGYFIVFLALRENSFAGRTVEVEETQKVIDSGPYAIIRHPFYAGAILMFLATPLALDSWWALIPTAFIIPAIIVRIFDEEKALTEDLSGYEAYLNKVKYRLVPGVW